MTHENFCYWLQGLLELDPGTTTLDAPQVAMIRSHLGYVFNKPVVIDAEATKKLIDAYGLGSSFPSLSTVC